MKLFLYLISIFWLLIGLTALITPLKLKTLYTNIVRPAKALFILPLIAGLLLLWAQGASRLVPFIMVLGIIALIKGLFILISPTDLLKSTFNYFLGRSVRWWRVYGVFIVLLGVVVGWSVM